MKETSAYRFGMIAMVAMGSGSAWACDSAYDTGTSCSSGGTAICAGDGSGNWTCNLDDGGTSGAQVWAVYSTELCEDKDYCVWGTTTSSTAFCCRFDISGSSLTINGSEYGDVFNYDYTTSPWDLSLEDYGGGAFYAITYGGEGEDEIYGSNENYYQFFEYLHGGDDDDLIEGDQGNDWIWGDDGYDALGAGGGNDAVSGGGGNDIIYGDDGDDVLCGDDNADTISGGSQTDLIWGGTGTDTMDGQNPTGGSESDQCGYGSGDSDTYTDCTGFIGTRPGNCPSL